MLRVHVPPRVAVDLLCERLQKNGRMKELNAKMQSGSKAGTVVRFSALQENGHIGDDRLTALTPGAGGVVTTDGKWTSLALPSRYGLDRVDQRPSRHGAAMV